jgi:hypothetical protein
MLLYVFEMLWFSLASSITKTGRHDIVEILLKVALNTNNQIQFQIHYSSLIVLNHKIINSTNICSKTYVHMIAEDSPIYSNGQTCQNQTLQPLLVFNATFSNISTISWRPVLVMEEARENHDPGQATGKLYHLRLRVECTLFVNYKVGREPTPYW